MLSVGHFSAKLSEGGERRGKKDIYFFLFSNGFIFFLMKKS